MLRRLFLFSATAIVATRADSAGPQGFYVVSVASSLGYRILDVKQRGVDSLVRYVRISTRSFSCPLTVLQAVETIVPNTTPAELVGNNDPCAVKPDILKAAIKKYAHRARTLEAVSLGVVAQCDGRPVSLMLPSADSVKWKKLKAANPEMAYLWDLPADVIDRAFGSKEIFKERNEEEDLALQQAAQKLIPALTAGQYDAGLAEAVRGAGDNWDHPSFKALLWEYPGPLAISQTHDMAQLLHPDRYHFNTFVAPQYPPLARQARIQGRVTLRLTVNQATGDVTAVTSVSGHPLLQNSAIEAAKQWRFALNFPTPETIDVSLDYVIRCPTYLQP